MDRSVWFNRRTIRSLIDILNYKKGRLCQHLTETAGFNLDSTLLFVLDEADRMLDMGFKTQIDRIISYLPKVIFKYRRLRGRPRKFSL